MINCIKKSVSNEIILVKPNSVAIHFLLSTPPLATRILMSPITGCKSTLAVHRSSDIIQRNPLIIVGAQSFLPMRDSTPAKAHRHESDHPSLTDDELRKEIIARYAPS